MSVLSIDAGTSACKVGVFSEAGLVASAGREYPILSPKPGYAELDAADAWKRIKEAVAEAIGAARGKTGGIKAVSFSSMGETMVPVRMDRTVAGPCLLSYDVRGMEYAEKLDRDIGQDALFRINPNFIGPYFSYAKVMWLKDHMPEMFAKSDKILLFGDFIGFMLGAEPYAVNSLANRTLLLDIKKCDWSDRLLEWSGIAREKLGRIVKGGVKVGEVSPDLLAEFGIEGPVEIVAGGHDQCCNALGCGCTRSGLAVLGAGTYETYCPVFEWPSDPAAFLNEIHNFENHVVDGLYAAFLYHHSGLLSQWFRNVFAPEWSGLDNKTVHARLEAEMPGKPTNILFFPHNEAPQWPRYDGATSGLFVGLKTATTRGDMYRAFLEGTALYFVDAIAAMKRMGMTPDVFLASGGASRSDNWLQLRADVLGVPFERLETGEGSLAGAAMLAAMRAGMFAGLDEAAAAWVRRGRVFAPDAGRHAYYRESAALYKRIRPGIGPLMKDMNLRGQCGE
ncbi:MAG: hypothetical protein LBT97_09545 [Planctomycetota bacterium]|jgi:xylulokinase|nr:hypothetical protein [Planctomycetota bacterium]